MIATNVAPRPPIPSTSDTESIESLSSNQEEEEIRASLLQVAETVLADPQLHGIASAENVLDAFLSRLTPPNVVLDQWRDPPACKLMASFVAAISETTWEALADQLDVVRSIQLPAGLTDGLDYCARLFNGLNHFPYLERVSIPDPAGEAIDARGCNRRLEIEFSEVHHPMQVLVGGSPIVYGSGHIDDECDFVFYGDDGEPQVSLPLPMRSELPAAPLLGAMELPPPQTITLLRTLQNQVVNAVESRNLAKVRSCVQSILNPSNRFTAQQRARALRLEDISGGTYSLLNWAHVMAFQVAGGSIRIKPEVLQAITNLVASPKGEILDEHRIAILTAHLPAMGGNSLLLRLADPNINLGGDRSAFNGWGNVPFDGALMTAFLGEIVSSRSLSTNDKDLICSSVPIDRLQNDPAMAATMWTVIWRAAPSDKERQLLLRRLGVELKDVLESLQDLVDQKAVSRPVLQAIHDLKGWNMHSREIPAATLAKLDIGLRAFDREARRAQLPSLSPIREAPANSPRLPTFSEIAAQMSQPQDS